MTSNRLANKLARNNYQRYKKLKERVEVALNLIDKDLLNDNPPEETIPAAKYYHKKLREMVKILQGVPLQDVYPSRKIWFSGGT